MSEVGLIPDGYFNIDDLWFDVRYRIINEVISSAIKHISLDIPDFKPKWQDIPEEKIDEWIDFVFGYDVRLWKSYSSDRNPDAIKYIIGINKFSSQKFTFIKKGMKN